MMQCELGKKMYTMVEITVSNSAAIDKSWMHRYYIFCVIL